MRRVLLISQFFYPENFKSTDIAFELSKEGFEVDVLTSIPNYPKGEYYKGYGIFKNRIQNINNTKIYRSFQINRGNGKSNIRLSLNYISFAIFSSIWVLFFLVFKKYDSIIVHQTTPITQTLPALVYNFFRKTSIYIWVLDLWPEAFLSGSGKKEGAIYNVLHWYTKIVYKKSTKILVSSKAFTQSILEKGNYEHKIVYFPNWSIDFKDLSLESNIPELPEGFIIMFAGNIGVSQDVESILNLALQFKFDNRVKFVVIGDGSKKKWLEEQIELSGLSNIVYTLGQYPLEYMPSFYKKADAMLLTLSGKFNDLSLYMPAKLQSYMSSGKPILAMINGPSYDLINEANCGYAVESGEYLKMAEIIKRVILPNEESFAELGNNGRKYYEGYFTKDKCIDNLINIITNN
ncbi:MAG: glycosyltransferase family 4 protein [Bacteroidales bacterium]|jgi:glycosyltransferase involved in cell wall biosynthesis|nr:glycosyltransferase family 4 protein [Synergistaceae bacterium]MDD3915392.1 glycosyltransferase family 4 protein [Bacteroidales bacterium]